MLKGIAKNVKNIFVGEQSALRCDDVVVKTESNAYVVDNTKVDYDLTRQLYQNSHENYKLGGGFCKPVINALNGFVGVPKFVGHDENAIYVIETYIEELNNVFNKLQKNIFRDGDCYIQVLSKKNENDALYNDDLNIWFKTLIPENVNIISDETGKVIQAIVKTKVTHEIDEKIDYEVTEIWTNETYKKVYKLKDVPSYLESELQDIEMENVYKFIPIIEFENDKEDYMKNGTSEIECIEPYIRAYHDVMLDSLSSTKLNSKPKLKIRVSDFQTFLTRNFTDEEIRNKSLKIGKKDVVFLNDNEEMDYIEVTANTHTILLEFLFMCIVDASETPEFIFGTAVSSSKASVSEQLTPFNKKVKRKREELTNNYKILARMFFSMWNFNNIGNNVDDFQVDIEFEETNKESEASKVTTLKTLIDGLTIALNNKMVSYETVIKTLNNHIPEMKSYEDEKQDILDQLAEMGMSDDVSEELKAELEALKNNENDENDENDDLENNGDDEDVI